MELRSMLFAEAPDTLMLATPMVMTWAGTRTSPLPSTHEMELERSAAVKPAPLNSSPLQEPRHRSGNTTCPEQNIRDVSNASSLAIAVSVRCGRKVLPRPRFASVAGCYHARVYFWHGPHAVHLAVKPSSTPEAIAACDWLRCGFHRSNP